MLKVAIAAALSLACLSAQDWARQNLEKSPRHGEWVQVKERGRNVRAFVVYPEVRKKTTAVIVIHENRGLTDWDRSMADQVAAKGYIAIAPDLIGDTNKFASADAARDAIYKLEPDAITADLNAVADYAARLSAGNGKVAVAGFCWGGGQAFRFATNRPDLRAAFVFYGPGPESAGSLKAPVYGFYGGNDARINAGIPKTQEMMKAAGRTYEPVIYDGAGHGFMRSGEDSAGRPEDRKAREQAWKRWEGLLGKL